MNGLECAACGNTKLRVSDSRRCMNSVRRRRSCSCGARFTTFEVASPTDEDNNRLLDALQLYDKVRSIPWPQRKAVLAMIEAIRGPMPEGFAPPLIPHPTKALPTPGGDDA